MRQLSRNIFCNCNNHISSTFPFSLLSVLSFFNMPFSLYPSFVGSSFDCVPYLPSFYLSTLLPRLPARRGISRAFSCLACLVSDVLCMYMFAYIGLFKSASLTDRPTYLPNLSTSRCRSHRTVRLATWPRCIIYHFNSIHYSRFGRGLPPVKNIPVLLFDKDPRIIS